jgi:hypothetical protein
MGVFNRNIVDDNYNQTDVALPAADGVSYSATIDLGDVDSVGENHELLITVPDLTVTHLPNADTLTVAVCAGAATDPTALIADSIEVFTGAGGAGASGTSTRFRLPSDCPRYVRVRFTAAGGTGDMSAVDAVVGLRF